MRMKSYKKRAFSLTELLIVLVIVALLFAALAPILTKRHLGSMAGNEPVWMFVNDDEQKDAYYDPGMHQAASTAYIGFKPTAATKPYAKVVIKASDKVSSKKIFQNMIQFRYGSGNGTLSGIFYADSHGNYINSNNIYHDGQIFMNTNPHNTLLGADVKTKEALRGVYSNYAVAVGAGGISPGIASVTVGASAGKRSQTALNKGIIVLGANSGLGVPSSSSVSNVIAGANVMSLKESVGGNNVVLGSNVATAGLKNGSSTQTGVDKDVESNNNVLIGSRNIGAEYMKQSTIIGAGAYNGGYKTAIGMTAIGYNSCSSMELAMPNGGNRTCIGTTSGQAVNSSPLSFNTDKYDHIFLGGAPMGGFGGRSVLEVHGTKDAKHTMSVKPNEGDTVVLNSHLVVRGNLYFPFDSHGQPSPHVSAPMSYGGEIQSRDWCTKGCTIWGHRKWRHHDGCVKIGGSPFRKRPREPLSNSAMYSTDSGDSFLYRSFLPQINRPYFSDIRLKENISENTDSLSKLLNIVPYNYTYKSDKKALPQVGVVAQDLQTYMPNSVSTRKDGFLQIRWDEMFYAVINSIKALAIKVDNLLADVNKLEKDSVKLANEQKSVKNRINNMNKRLNKLER